MGEGVGGPATGFEEAGEVLGETDETDEAASQTNGESRDQVLGASISYPGWQVFLPMILLVLQLLALSIFEIIKRRDSSAVKLVMALGVLLASILSYYLLRNPDCYGDGSAQQLLNNWYWLAALLIAALVRLVGYGFIDEVETE